MYVKKIKEFGKFNFKVLILLLLIIILYIISVFLFLIPSIEKSLIAEKEEMTKRIMEVVFSDLSNIYQQVKHYPEHIIAYEKEKILKRYESLRFGYEQKDYFWIISPDVTVLMHPYMPNIVGHDSRKILGPDGEPLHLILEKMVLVAQNNINGDYVEYFWQFKDKKNLVARKLSYVKEFKPWQWIIGTGVYLDDLQIELKDKKIELLYIGLYISFLGIFFYFILSYLMYRYYIKENENNIILEQNKKIISKLFEESFDPILVLKKLKIIDCNKSALDFFKMNSKKQIIGKTPLDISPDYQADIELSTKLIKIYTEKIQKFGFARFEWIFKDFYQNVIPADLSVFRVNSYDKSIYYTVIRDNTKQISIREELRENRDRIRTTLNSIGDGVISTDANGFIIEMNPSAEKILYFRVLKSKRYHISELLKVYDINYSSILSFDSELKAKDIIKILENKKNVLLLIEKNIFKHISLQINPIKDENGIFDGLVTVFSDISNEYQLHEKIKKSEILFRTIFVTSPFPIIIIDRETLNLIKVNKAFEVISGNHQDEVIGKTISDIKLIKKTEKLNYYLSMVDENKLIEHQPMTLENRKGDIVEIIFSLVKIEYENKPCLLSISVDITEIKKLEEQFRQSQKMDIIGQLAGGVAHDFNNMLSGIKGFAELLYKSVPDNTKEEKYLKAIIDNSDKAASLTQKLLMFSRKVNLEKKCVDVHESIQATILLLKRTINPLISIEKSFSAINSKIIGDSTLLYNVFLNLAVNARDAIKDNGRIRISTENVKIENYEINHNFKENYIMISVEDNGHGIPKENLDKIFEPFFTTKPLGKGTGLGLSAVFGTVKEHNGLIKVESEKDKGTIFKIFFPIVFDNDKSSNEKKDYDFEYGKGQLLIVDDEKMILDFVSDFLTELGYFVDIVNDGYEAIEKSKSKSYDLIIIDIIMPKINGFDTAQRILDNTKDTKILFSSGYSKDIDKNRLSQLSDYDILFKPYSLKELSRLVSKIIKDS